MTESASGAPLRILVVHGPNLNTLGRREPAIYGTTTLDEINARLAARAAELGCEAVAFQSNAEGALIDYLQAEGPSAAGLVLNAGGLSHTSVALRDAVAGMGRPAIEVHLSNIYAREPFRHTSLLAPVCRGQICGLGWRGYLYALDALVATIRENGAKGWRARPLADATTAGDNTADKSKPTGGTIL